MTGETATTDAQITATQASGAPITGAPITGAQIRRYGIDGAVLLKGVLDKAATALLEQGVEEAYRAETRTVTRLDGERGAETLVRDYASQHSPALRALLATGEVGRIAAALMGTSSAQVVLDQIFYKSRGPILPTPWHQDTPFLRVRGQDLVRLWFPCDPSPRALTVQVVRGSHRWNVVYNTGSMADGGGDGRGVGDSWLPPAPDVARHRDSFDVLEWDVEPGDALAFQGNMLHGAEGDPAHDRPRRAFAILLGGPDLRFHRPEGRAFPSPGRMSGARADDAIPHGARIGDYPDAFPPC